MEENLTSVNAEQVSAESSQDTGDSVIENQQSNAEPIKQTETSQPQSREENAAWKQMRLEKENAAKEAEKLKRDIDYAKKYGKEYGVFSEKDIQQQYGHQGINSWDDLEMAIEAQQKNVDLETMKYAKKGKQIEEQEQLTQKQIKEKEDFKQKQFAEFAQRFPDFTKEIVDQKAEFPKEVLQALEDGRNIADVYENLLLKEKLAKFEAEKAEKENAEKSIGSATGTSTDESKDLISKEAFEANKHDQQWVSKNLNKLQKSMKHW